LNEEIALWRAILPGGVTITGFVIWRLAMLRNPKCFEERSDANEKTPITSLYSLKSSKIPSGLVNLDQNLKLNRFKSACEKLLSALSALVGQPLNVFIQFENTMNRELVFP